MARDPLLIPLLLNDKVYDPAAPLAVPERVVVDAYTPHAASYNAAEPVPPFLAI